MKITVIHHSADFDGLFCREVARKFLPPETEFIGWDWRDKPIPFPSEGYVYVLDLSPDCFESLPAHQERLIWIDHHKSAIDKFPTVWPGYRIDGVAACRLAWIWFKFVEAQSKPGMGGDRAWVEGNYPFPTKQDFIDRKIDEPLAVRLAGEYDIWDKRDPRAETFQFGLRSMELSPTDWDDLLSGSDVLTFELLGNGKMLQQYQQRNDAGTMPRSFMVEFEGLKFLTLNTARCNSLTFASKDVPETGHDALMGYFYDGEKWNFSMYHAAHRTDLDLSVIAAKYFHNGKSGGGHRGACGFQFWKIPF